jgi:hypothetical protein
MEHQEHTYTPIDVTPDLAQHMLIHEMYARQRPAIPMTIQNYALQMKAGTWRPWSLIAACVLHGKRSCINGKQRLSAIVLSGVTVPLVLEEIQVQTEEEIGEWYAIHDQHDRRSLAVRFDALNLPDTLQFNKSQAKLLSACLPLMASGFAPASRGMSLRMYTDNVMIRRAFMHEWKEEAHIFFQLIKGASQAITSSLRRAAVMPIALVTLRFTGTDAEEFWQNVAMNDRLAKDDPRQVLHLFLRTSNVLTIDWHVLCRYPATAWNAAYEERAIQHLQIGNAERPLRLEGTPHTGKEILRYITPRGEMLHTPRPYNPDTWQQEMFSTNGH